MSHILKRLLHSLDFSLCQLEEDIKNEGTRSAHLFVEHWELFEELLVQFLSRMLLIFHICFNRPKAASSLLKLLDLFRVFDLIEHLEILVDEVSDVVALMKDTKTVDKLHIALLYWVFHRFTNICGSLRDKLLEDCIESLFVIILHVFS